MQIIILYHHCVCVGVLIESRSADNHGASSSGVNNTTEASLEKELHNGVKNGL